MFEFDIPAIPRMPLFTVRELKSGILEERFLDWLCQDAKRLLDDFYEGETTENTHAQDSILSFYEEIDPMDANERVILTQPTLLDIEAISALFHSPAMIQDNEGLSATVADYLVSNVESEHEDKDEDSDECDNTNGAECDLLPSALAGIVDGANALSLDRMAKAIVSIQSRLLRQGLLADPKTLWTGDPDNKYIQEDDFYDDSGLPAMNLNSKSNSEDSDDFEEQLGYVASLFVADNIVALDGLSTTDFLDRRHDHIESSSVCGGASQPLADVPSDCCRIAIEWRRGLKLMKDSTRKSSGDIDWLRRIREKRDMFPECHSTPSMSFPKDCYPTDDNAIRLMSDVVLRPLIERSLMVKIPYGPFLLRLIDEIHESFMGMKQKLRRNKTIGKTVMDLVDEKMILKSEYIVIPPEGDLLLKGASLESSADDAKMNAKDEKLHSKSVKEYEDLVRHLGRSEAVEAAVIEWSEKVVQAKLNQLGIAFIFYPKRVAISKWKTSLRKCVFVAHGTNWKSFTSKHQAVHHDQWCCGLSSWSGIQSVLQPLDHLFQCEVSPRIGLLLAIALSWIHNVEDPLQLLSRALKAYKIACEEILLSIVSLLKDVLHSIFFSSCAVVHDRIDHDIISMPELLYSNEPVHASEQVHYSDITDITDISGGIMVVEDTGTSDITDISGGIMVVEDTGTSDITDISGGIMVVEDTGISDITIGTCELGIVVEDTQVVMVDDASQNITPIHTMAEVELSRTPSPFHGENTQSSTTSTGLDGSTKSELRHHEINQGTVLHELFYNGLLGEALQGREADDKLSSVLRSLEILTFLLLIAGRSRLLWLKVAQSIDNVYRNASGGSEIAGDDKDDDEDIYFLGASWWIDSFNAQQRTVLGEVIDEVESYQGRKRLASVLKLVTTSSESLGRFQDLESDLFKGFDFKEAAAQLSLDVIIKLKRGLHRKRTRYPDNHEVKKKRRLVDVSTNGP
eukprot:GHVH01010975.1.p1 GENE.GHVH01010975.1~~GHVH01010975.1.p1  ORF type:complete len:1107 (+),score=190.97 GHVH01010975.1:422-3322(+)